MPKVVENLFSEYYMRLVQAMDALSQITSHFIFAGLLDRVRFHILKVIVY